MEINGSDPVDGQLKADTEIDMSLDDIIQLHKEEENDPQDAEAIVQPKNILLYTFGSRDKGFHVQASLQGVSRLRRGLKQGGYNGSQWKTTQISGSGLSPLNRHAFVQKNEKPFVEGANNWQEKIPRRRLQPKRTFRLPVVPTGLPKRTVPQTRRPAHLPPYRIQRQPRYPPLNRIQRQPRFLPLHRTQRQSKFNLNRAFLQRASLRSPIEGTKTGRWPSTAISGSVLTVSVPNPKASQEKNLPRSSREPTHQLSEPIHQLNEPSHLDLALFSQRECRSASILKQ
ncbi:UAP56-interacting factor-like isoform X2 [Ambystoma mexicanum]|uniref:UAP56-interacting factor-like isoform X2 n=1 Tax=Ambystoma mexicanum TaxID=8296 RepID=UPI0037E84EB6